MVCIVSLLNVWTPERKHAETSRCAPDGEMGNWASVDPRMEAAAGASKRSQTHHLYRPPKASR